MCWSIGIKEFNENPEKYHKIAEEDITVYKFGIKYNKKFLPAYQDDFGYEPNIRNDKVEIKLIKDGKSYHGTCYFYVNEGYHSYSEKCHLLNDSCDVGVYSKIFDEKYLDFYTLVDDFIGKFIIPKGSEFYENEDGEIVSSNIMWTGEGIYFSDIDINNTIKLKELCVGV